LPNPQFFFHGDGVGGFPIIGTGGIEVFMSAPAHFPPREACDYLLYEFLAGPIRIPFPNSIQTGPLPGKKLRLGPRIGKPPAPSLWIPLLRLIRRKGKGGRSPDEEMIFC
jgi:hypothetical protein